jgi:uncharacterized membrane protein (UPF0127 family)
MIGYMLISKSDLAIANNYAKKTTANLLDQPYDIALPKTKPFIYAPPTEHISASAPIYHLAVAVSQAAKNKGLMQQKINDTQGMIFVFDPKLNDKPCFWMKNTIQDLGVIFLDAKGKVLQKEFMKAGTTNLHCAKQNTAYAVELTTQSTRKILLGGHFIARPFSN